jgi:DNA-binding winged helix-turn-helix (wHTH) protein
MPSDPAKVPSHLCLGENFELDVRLYELRRAGRVLKLERIPMELLLLFVEKKGELVTRDQIIERIWGKDVFLDTDNSINAAVRKIRLVLKDDPLHPRFLQTITGRGYRFIGPVVEARPEPATVTSIEQLRPSHLRYLSTLGQEAAAIQGRFEGRFEDRFSEKQGEQLDQPSRAANRLCRAGERSRCSQSTPATRGCAPGHGHGSGRNRQDASRRAGGDRPG